MYCYDVKSLRYNKFNLVHQACIVLFRMRFFNSYFFSRLSDASVTFFSFTFLFHHQSFLLFSPSLVCFCFSPTFFSCTFRASFFLVYFAVKINTGLGLSLMPTTMAFGTKKVSLPSAFKVSASFIL